MSNIKLCLTAVLCAALVFAGAHSLARAETVPAVPVGAVAEEELPAEKKPLTPPVLAAGPVVVELFSSQACVFCPRADRLLADLAQQAHVIALACHVDYFDVRVGSLARRFCTDRQNWYMRTLRAGPNYTPQMVVQGRNDVVGYDIPAVIDALRRVAGDIPPAIAIAYQGRPGQYALTLPQGRDVEEGARFRLWLMLYDRAHELIVAEGRNKGQKMRYVNIVSDIQDLGVWSGGAEDMMAVEIARKAEQRGFAVIAQDEKTGRIAAAGRYHFGQEKGADAVQGPVRTLND